MKVIERICLATRVKKDRKLLIRVVKTPQGNILIDEEGKLPGRGAYISRDADCIALARKKNLLARALRCNVDSSIYDDLLKLIQK
ncbi:MAG: YlxR family protein [Bacilli bacterium]|nr:YlxR family protein [Bacilli bacterium]